MGTSRKSDNNRLLERIAAALRPVVPDGSSIALGLSGGVDSVVLLHLLRQLSVRHAWRLSAVHIHHGISPHADAWAAFCGELCAREGIPVQIEQVDITPLRHLGIEAAARTLRHAVLARQQVDFIALAHHQDDQVETLLLQLLRGAGVRGVSAMPVFKQRIGAPAIVRPLLDIARSTLLAYAQQYALQWVEDESNADDAYPRNFLRHRVLPLLQQRFPAYRATLARSARHFAEASELLDELARQDAQVTITAERLNVVQLQMLDAVRGKNLLRHFIAERGAPIPDSNLLEEMLRQIVGARQDAQVCITWQQWQIRRYRGHAYILPELITPTDFNVVWRGENELRLPQPHGVIHFDYAIGQGISQSKLLSGQIEIRPRSGGEKLRPDAARPQRTLKNLMQEQGILPWQRDVLPLLFCGADLVCVPGVATACAYRAQPGENGIVVNWQA